jgi:hypothetical protein
MAAGANLVIMSDKSCPKNSSRIASAITAPNPVKKETARKFF